MQPLRGTRDILPDEIKIWQRIYEIANTILNQHNYIEIRTPILENTELFQRSIGNFTDIVNKEMYSFNDQSKRNITLRPEGTASIARAVISNKLHIQKTTNRLWYLGPMFRYERPQKGRQRQFHQLGVECIGSSKPIADVEVIRLAIQVLQKLECMNEYKLEINSIGNQEERKNYKTKLVEYLEKYENELDNDSKKRLNKNPLRILDSKCLKVQEILQHGPILKDYLGTESLKHFEYICENLTYLKINYKINNYLVRGLDYYNYTAFEIKSNEQTSQNTLCGGGRYDNLISQLGGPKVPAVGWAIGIERIINLRANYVHSKKRSNLIYIATQNKQYNIYNTLWDTIDILEEYNIKFELDLSNNNLGKQIKRADQIDAKICFILGEDEIKNKSVTIKWLETGVQQSLYLSTLRNYVKYLKKIMIT